MKKNTKFIFKLAISSVFLLWVVYRVDWQEVWVLLQGIKIGYIVLYYIILILGIAISARKWQLLASFKDIKLPFGDFFKFYLAGTFVNNFMPSFIGGDTFRAYQIGKVEKKYSQAASSVVIDRLTGLFGAMLLTLIFSAMNFTIIMDNHILVLLNMVILACVGIVFLFFATRQLDFWKKENNSNQGLRKYIPAKIANFMLEMKDYNNNTNVLWRAVVWSMVFNMVGLAAANFLFFLALGVSINPLDYLSVIFLISVLSAAPISINNIGVKEWAYVTFFGFFGVSSAVVITVAILSRFLQMFLSFLALPVYLQNKK